MSNAPQSPLWSPAPFLAAPVALPPWEIPPDLADPFDFFGVLDTPIAGAAEATVLSFLVPAGYACVIRDLTHFVEGPALTQGSGDLTWALRFDKQIAKNYGQIKVTFGNMDNPRAVYGLRAKARTKVSYSVINTAYLSAGTRITGYPAKSRSMPTPSMKRMCLSA